MGRDKGKIKMENAEKLEQLEKEVAELRQRLDARYASPMVQCSEEFGLYEAVFDVLVMKKVATQQEISHYLDQYKQIWVAIINILIDKKVATPKELNCAILAYHHFFRTEGFNSLKSQQELFEARQKYTQELMKLPDPTIMIGH